MTRRELGRSLIAGFATSALGIAAEDRKVNTVLAVSLLKVIANPEKYNGKKLRLIGFLNFGAAGFVDEALSLYVSQADGRYTITANAIALGRVKLKVLNEKLIGRYVVLEGTFHASDPFDGEEEHAKLVAVEPNGTLEDVDRLELFESEEYRKK